MKQWQSSRNVAPVLLISGVPGTGKRDVAIYLAKWLLCKEADFSRSEKMAEADLFGGAPSTPQPPSLVPCGECSSCRRFESGNQFDFTEYAPEDGKHRIETFRDLKASLGHGAIESAFKVVLIRDAEMLTPQAANSLLKLLEEPPPGWVFFLTAPDPSLLLPTLISRCQKLRLKPQEPSGTDAKTDEALVELVDYWRSFLSHPNEKLNALVDLCASDDRKFSQVLDLMERTLHERLRGSIASVESRRTFWLNSSERIADTRAKLGAPLNRKLLANDVLLPWLSA